MLPLEMKGHGTKCKMCKARITEWNAKKTKERDAARMKRFKTAQEWNEFNERQFQANPNIDTPHPKRKSSSRPSFRRRSFEQQRTFKEGKAVRVKKNTLRRIMLANA